MLHSKRFVSSQFDVQNNPPLCPPNCTRKRTQSPHKKLKMLNCPHHLRYGYLCVICMQLCVHGYAWAVLVPFVDGMPWLCTWENTAPHNTFLILSKVQTPLFFSNMTLFHFTNIPIKKIGTDNQQLVLLLESSWCSYRSITCL